jgi:hypothetical protein
VDLDWIRAMLNAQGNRSGLLYSLREAPMDCIQLVAWLARSKLVPPEANRPAATGPRPSPPRRPT